MSRCGWLVVVFFAVLTCVHTWPLATDPAGLSRHDSADASLNAWAMAWIGQSLLTDPANLFNGNIFHPEPRTIAFSEPLIVPALIGAPLLGLGASPVLTYNVLVLVGLLLMAVATSSVVTSWTGDRMAGALSGTLFAFSTTHMTRLPHMQALHGYWLALALWALDRLLTHGRTRDALWLALFLAGAAYTSGYLAVFTVVAVTVATLVRPDDWGGEYTRTRLPRLVLAALAAGALVWPLARVYRQVSLEQGFVRPVEYVLSGTPASFLASGARVHSHTWSADWWASTSEGMFPGVLAIGLTLIALCRLRRTIADGRIRMLVAVGAAGFVLSLGLRTPVYEAVYHVFPPMQGLRAAARFGELTVLACAMLAGWGLADLRRWCAGRRRLLVTMTVAAVIVANVEGLHAPMQYVRFDGVPELYRVIARDPEAVVAEMPFFTVGAFFRHAPYMLYSTAHRRPLLNGYSGFAPQSFRDTADVLWYFPARGIDLLYERGVGYVVVHLGEYRRTERAAIMRTLAERPDFRALAVDARHNIVLYRFLREVHEEQQLAAPGP